MNKRVRYRSPETTWLEADGNRASVCHRIGPDCLSADVTELLMSIPKDTGEIARTERVRTTRPTIIAKPEYRQRITYVHIVTSTRGYYYFNSPSANERVGERSRQTMEARIIDENRFAAFSTPSTPRRHTGITGPGSGIETQRQKVGVC